MCQGDLVILTLPTQIHYKIRARCGAHTLRITVLSCSAAVRELLLYMFSHPD